MIVFDACTLIVIGRAELLYFFLTGIELEAAIPVEVKKECCGIKKSLDALLIQNALDELRIKVIAVKNRKRVVKLQGDFGLGMGEAEAIEIGRASCRER